MMPDRDRRSSNNNGVEAGLQESTEAERTRLTWDGSAQQECGSRLALPTSDGLIFIGFDQIIQLRAEGSYTWVNCEMGIAHLICVQLHQLELKLPVDKFIRCHHSHIINSTKVLQLIRTGGYRALLSTGTYVAISRRKWKAVLAAMKHV